LPSLLKQAICVLQNAFNYMSNYICHVKYLMLYLDTSFVSIIKLQT